MRPLLGADRMSGHHLNNHVSVGAARPDGCLADRPLADGHPEAARLPLGTGADVAGLMQRLQAAEREIAELKEALASQRLIGVAVGLLANRFHCSPDQAWRLLIRLSQNSNVKVREVARILADAHSGVDVSADADVLARLCSQLPGVIRPPRPGD